MNYLKSVPNKVQDLARSSADLDLTDYQREIVAALFNCSYASVDRIARARWKYSVNANLAMAKRCLAVVLMNDQQLRDIHDSDMVL